MRIKQEEGRVVLYAGDSFLRFVVCTLGLWLLLSAVGFGRELVVLLFFFLS